MSQTVDGCEWDWNFEVFLQKNHAKFGIEFDEASNIANDLETRKTVNLDSWNEWDEGNLRLKGAHRQLFLEIIKQILKD